MIKEKGFSIHPKTSIGYLSLTVANLAAQIEFYEDVLGFEVRRQEGQRVWMGSQEKDLLELVENISGIRYPRTTGLYHFALLYPDRRELARALGRLFAQGVPNSPTDHIMTKTTYLEDLEGNGIELYCESPEDGEWSLKNGEYITRRRDGSLSSGREPLDVESLFSYLKKEDRLDGLIPSETRLGHVHLHVADLQAAVDFYHGILGFDEMGQVDNAGLAFVSAGGYHHHIGLNTWQGKGAPAPAEDGLGLRYFSIALPGQEALDLVISRVEDQGISTQKVPEGFLIHDPSQNGVLLTLN